MLRHVEKHQKNEQANAALKRGVVWHYLWGESSRRFGAEYNISHVQVLRWFKKYQQTGELA